MKTAEYLDRCKEVMQITSDYELAERLNLKRQVVSYYRLGKRTPDVYACVKIAMALSLDPSAVIADLQAQTEKDPARLAFWRDFLSRATGAVAVRTLALIFTAFCAIAAAAPSPVDRAFFRRMKFV